MRNRWMPLVLLCSVVLALTIAVGSLHAQSVPAGLGASTFTCLDRDGDGYGVGTGCLGPDADDTDASVQTAVEGIAKYGSLVNFLNHLGAANPGGAGVWTATASRIWYISTSGNDSTCSSAGAPVGISSPCATFNTGVRAHLLAGDVVLWRTGTYSENVLSISGSVGSPIVYMAYPGEHVNLGGSTNSLFNAGDLHYAVIDGFSFDSLGYVAIGTSGINPTVSTFYNVTISHIHGNNSSSSLGDVYGFEGLTNLTIQDSVLHGNSYQHAIYIGAHNLPAQNVIIQRNIMYHNNWNGLHWNGRCTGGCVVSDNISYDNGISGLDFEMGYAHSSISNNLIFSNAKQLTIYDYESGQCPDRTPYNGPGTVNICPYDQNYNVIENNTIYGTGNETVNNPNGITASGCPTGTYDCSQPALGVSSVVNPADGPANQDLGHNTFRNNVVVNYGGNGSSVIRPPLQFGNSLSGGAFSNCDTTCMGWLASSGFSNNVFFMNNGNGSATVLMAAPNFYGCAAAAVVTAMNNCIDGDPQFVAASPKLWSSVASFNFNLQLSSPAVGAGTNVGAPTTDITGRTRNNPPSIGAYEAGAINSSPSVPTGLAASSVSSSQINLSWGASTDSSGTIAGYKVYRAGVAIGTTAATTYQDNGLAPATTYTYAVAAYDTLGNTSAQSTPASATTGSSGGGYAVGWTELLNTRLVDVCPDANGNIWPEPEVSDGNNYDFFTNCATLVNSDWSGGVGDTKRDRLIIWGGGHSDYAGNEVYSLNLLTNPVSLIRLNNPSTPAVFDRNAGCGKITSTTYPFQANANSNDNWAMYDGRPNTRHDTGGLTYMPSVDAMYLFNGGVACGNAPHYFDTWWLDMANISSTGTGGWTQKDPLNGINLFTGASAQFGQFFSATAWDPNTSTVAVWTPNQMFSYDPATNTMKLLNNNLHLALSSSVVIDPKRKLFIAIGVEYAGSGATYNPNYNVMLFCYSSSSCTGNWGTIASYQALDVTTRVVNSGTCGPVIYSPTNPPGWDQSTGPINQPEPGMAYDPVVDRTVLWPNHGSTVYLFNPDTLTCAAQTFAGPVPPSGPGAVASQMSGTFGRFRYFPDLDIFALVSDATKDAYVLRLNNGSAGGSGGPSVSVALPLAGTTVSGNVTLSATVSDTVSITSVQFLVDGVAVGPALTAAPYSTVWSSTQVSNGSHSVYARAIDVSGRSALSGPVTITISNASTGGPSVNLTSPPAGATVSSNVTLSATASAPAGISNVQFLVDGTALGGALTVAPYAAIWNSTQVNNGSHTLSARATDTRGASAMSNAITVTVSNQTGTGGGGQGSTGPLYPAIVDSSTVFHVQVDDLATIFACPECYFRSAADVTIGQSLEVKFRPGSSVAQQVVLKQGTIEGTIASIQGRSFVLTPSNPIFQGRSFTVVTGNVTLFDDFPNFWVNVGEKIAVRGLLLRSTPGGPTLIAKRLSLIR